MTIDHLVQLSHELKRLGCGVSITMTVQLPLDRPVPEPVITAGETAAAVLVEADEPPKATIRTVMHVLNRLHAAAGQPNRDRVRRFLFHRGWLGAAEEPESWNLDHVPISKDGITWLAEEIQAFVETERKP